MAVIGSRRISDKVLDVTTFILATATLAYYTSRYLTTSAWIVAGIWLAFAIVLFAILRRVTDPGFYGEPVPAPYVTSDPAPHRTNRLARNATYAGLIAAVFAFLYIDKKLPVLTSTQWALIILVLVAIGGVLAFKLASTPVATPADYKNFHWFPWAVGAGLALISSATLRPQSDDTNYLNLSTWIAERGTMPTRDTIYSDQVFTTKPLGSAWESMWGVIAHVTGISAPTLLYVIAVPVLTLLSVLALDRGLRSMHVRHTNFAILVVSIFLLLDGKNIFSFGVFHGPRIWQGKSFFVSAMVPLLIAAGIVWARSARRNDLIRFLLIGLATAGLTTTATMLVPMIVVVIAVVVGHQRGVQDAGWTLLAMLAPLYVGLAFRGAHEDDQALGDWAGNIMAVAQPGSVVSGITSLPDANEFVRWMSRPPLHAALFALVMCWGFIGAESRTARRVIAGLSVMWAIVYLPPVLALIEQFTGVQAISWRFWWLLPIPLLVGAAASAVAAGLIRFTSTNKQRTVTLILSLSVLLALIVVPGKFVWNSSLGQENGQSSRLMWPPGWKVFGGYLEAKIILDEIAEDGDIIAARSNIEKSLAATTVRIHPVLPKISWFTQAGGAEAAESLPDRLQIRRFTSTQPSEELPELNLADLPNALDRVGVNVICLDADRAEEIELALSWGYTQGAQVVKFEAGRGQWCARKN
jgi:uncharacterized membrane protein YiaA